MTVIYTKLAADGTDLPADHPNEGPNKHLAVRVTRTDIPGWSEILAAYRCAGSHSFKKAQEVAAGHSANGWSWRTGSPESLFLVTDRADPANHLPREFFPDAEDYETTWTNLPDAESPCVYAWFVYLGYGGANRNNQTDHYGVRAVCAGQS